MINFAFSGGGITALVSSDELGRSSFSASIGDIQKTMRAAAENAAKLASSAESASKLAADRANREASEGMSCLPGTLSAKGPGDIYLTRTSDRDELGRLAASVKAAAVKLETSAASIDTAIEKYTVDKHDDVVTVIRGSLADARLVAADLGTLQQSSDLLARKARAEGGEFKGPKTGRPLTCRDAELATDLKKFVEAKPVEIGNPVLPPRPTLRTAVQAFVGAVVGLLNFKGIDWPVFGPGLLGVLPDLFIVAAWAQLLAHMSRGRTVADTLRNTFSLGEDTPWDGIEAAARRAAADRLLGELEALHVFANGRDYVVVPAEVAHEHHRHVAEGFVDQRLASFKGRGRLDVLIGAKSVSRLPGETIVDIFEIDRGVWSKFRADVRRASGETTNNDNVRPFRSAGAPH